MWLLAIMSLLMDGLFVGASNLTKTPVATPKLLLQLAPLGNQALRQRQQ